MFKLLLFVACIYIIVGCVVEVNAKTKKDEKITFDVEALKRVIKWPWILFPLG